MRLHYELTINRNEATCRYDWAYREMVWDAAGQCWRWTDWLRGSEDTSMAAMKAIESIETV